MIQISRVYSHLLTQDPDDIREREALAEHLYKLEYDLDCTSEYERSFPLTDGP